MTRPKSSRALAGQDSASLQAAFAEGLRYDDIPAKARAAATACLIDAMACAIFGSRLPWSQHVVAATSLPPGESPVPGTDLRTTPDKAALLAGVFAHGFELDSLRKPGSGVHPGATVALPALAVAHALGASRRDLIAAIVAGIELMFRLGAATLHTAEKRGFHAPEITGVFGSAIAAGKLMGLSRGQLAHAMGLAGSMSGGILAFVGSGTGGMVKRLHLGRAAESGVVAATLAKQGFEAPADIFETQFGVLETFCAETDPSWLNRDLGTSWEIEKLCIKRYACHVTAQAPIELLAAWRTEHGFGADTIDRIEMDVPVKIASHHAEKRPADLGLAQYSVPFILAFSVLHDLDDPASLTEHSIRDPRVAELCDRIRLDTDASLKGWNVRLRVHLSDGRVLEGMAETFLGAPDRPLSPAQLRSRFDRLTRHEPPEAMETLFRQLADEAAAEIVARVGERAAGRHRAIA